jgi:hypothetical protein
MSGSDAMWAALSSQNERVVQRNEPTGDSAGYPAATGRSRWAALASQRERLVDTADPEFQLASGHASLSMRLVKGAA